MGGSYPYNSCADKKSGPILEHCKALHIRFTQNKFVLRHIRSLPFGTSNGHRIGPTYHCVKKEIPTNQCDVGQNRHRICVHVN